MGYRKPKSSGPLVLLAVLGLLLAGCGLGEERATQKAQDLAAGEVAWDDLPGHLVSDEPVWMIPGRAWDRHPDRPAWVAHGVGDFWVEVLIQPSQPLLFGFVAEPSATEPSATAPCLTARWDGAEVSDRFQVVEGGELRLSISPDELTPGGHRLVLTPCPADATVTDAMSDPPATPLIFQDLGFRRLPGGVVLDLDDLPRYRYLDDLLRRGVTSSLPTEKLAGMVFDGVQAARVRLPHDAGGALGLTLHNSSHLPKGFRLRAGSEEQVHTLGPHARQRVELPVAAGVGHLDLATEGENYGFGLWATPTLTPAPDATPPPSVVVITLDTTRRDLLATYGGPGLPHLDALASQATVYDYAYTTAPWTLPSHASLFTGLYPSRHGAGVVDNHLDPTHPTVAEHLAGRGYLTLGVAAGPLAGYLFGVAQGFGVYVDPEGAETPGGQVVDTVTTLLERHRPADRQPVFLFVNLFDPHFPYQGGPSPAPEALSDAWRRILAGDGITWNDAVAGVIPLDPQALDALGVAYRADAQAMDRSVGRLFEVLRRHRLLDEALVIVTADHGELLGEGGYLSHSGRLDPELLEVPLLVKWPGQRRGARRQELVSLVDLAPTVLRAAGVEPPEDLDGLDLGPTDEEARRSRGWVLAEEHHTPFHPLPPKMTLGRRAIAFETPTLRWVRADGVETCFERVETADASVWRPASPPCPTLGEAAQALDQRLATEAQRQSEAPLALSDEERARLEALGYLQ